MSIIKIYTDGSCLGNPGRGGYSFIVLDSKDNIKYHESKGYDLTTNNRMELMAVIAALKSFKSKKSIYIYTDSNYIKRALTEGWLENWIANDWKTKSNKKVKNIDLWKELLELINYHNDVRIKWIKAHSTNKINNLCDNLAKKAAKQDFKSLKKDYNYLSK